MALHEETLLNIILKWKVCQKHSVTAEMLNNKFNWYWKRRCLDESGSGWKPRPKPEGSVVGYGKKFLIGY